MLVDIMSTGCTTPLSKHESPSASEQRPQRTLACVLCQQRKIKCDRKFPCSNCTKAHVQCVPQSLHQRKRKRRFAERELLERLRYYETLLHKNNINFAAMHPPEVPSERASDPSKAVGLQTGAQTSEAVANDSTTSQQDNLGTTNIS